MRDRDGNVVYEGGKESSRNTKSMTRTMKSNLPLQRQKLQDESHIIERNKSPLLADLNSDSKQNYIYRKYSTQTSKLLGSRSATNSKSVLATKTNKRRNVNYND